MEMNRYSPGVFSPLGSDPTSPWSDFSTIRLGRLHTQLSIIIAIKLIKITYRLFKLLEKNAMFTAGEVLAKIERTVMEVI